jgi:hypothetical protein
VLIVVQYHCRSIFHYTEDIQTEINEYGDRKENYDNIDLTNESMLIETVVEKLIIIVERAVAKLEPAYKAGQSEEDQLIMCFQENWYMAVANVKKIVGKTQKTQQFNGEGDDMRATASTRSSAEFGRASMHNTKIEGVPEDLQDTWDDISFNALDIPAEAATPVALNILWNANCGSPYIKKVCGQTRFMNFVDAVRTACEVTNPFHNFAHATDVLATTSRCLTRCRGEQYLSERPFINFFYK